MTIIVKINMVITTICSLRVLVRIFGRQTLRISAKTLFTEIHIKPFVYVLHSQSAKTIISSHQSFIPNSNGYLSPYKLMKHSNVIAINCLLQLGLVINLKKEMEKI